MMPVAIDLTPPPAIIATEQAEPVRKKRRGDRRRTRSSAWVIGAIILMDDGSRCQIVEIDNGQPYCLPIIPP